uniref:DUF1981 domain-containing protein n=1 Tax=Rhabditophanes sp. KR3021 TaxID=114890 RepID=A0AC35UA67_9BILA
MEGILEKLLEVADQTNCGPVIKGHCEKAKEAASKAHLPIYVRRGECLECLALCLSSSNARLSHTAIQGLQFIIRDNTYSSDAAITRDEDSVCSQFVKYFHKMPDWDKQIKCQSLSLIMQLFSGPNIRISNVNIDEGMELCIQMYLKTDEGSVKLAVRGAITQFINSFCLNKYATSIPGHQDELAIFMEMTALLSKFVHRLETEALSGDEITLLLDAIYSLLSVQPISAANYKPFFNVLEQDLGILIQRMFEWKSNKRSKQAIYLSNMLSSDKNKSTTPDVFYCNEMVSSLYQIVEQLTRIYSKSPNTGPLLTNLFKLAFIDPPLNVRGEALKLMKRLFTNQTMLPCLGRLFLHKDTSNLFGLMMDCVIECNQSNIPQLHFKAIKVLHAIASGICELKKGTQQHLSPQYINDNFPLYVEEVCLSDNVEENKSVEVSNTTTTSNLKQFASHFVEQLNIEIDVILGGESSSEIDEYIQKVATNLFIQFKESEIGNSENITSDLLYLTIWSSLMFEAVKENGHRLPKEVFGAIITQSSCLLFMNEKFIEEVFWLLDSRSWSLFDNKMNEKNAVLFEMIEEITGFVLKYKSEPCPGDEERYVIQFKKTFHQLLFNLINQRWEVFTITLAKSNNKPVKEVYLEQIKTLQCIAKMSLSLNFTQGIYFALEHLIDLICPLDQIRTCDNIKNMPFRKIWLDGVEDLAGIGFIIEYGINFGILSSMSWKYIVQGLEYVFELTALLPPTPLPLHLPSGNSIPSSPPPIPCGESSFAAKDINQIIIYLNHIANKFVDTAALMLPLPDLRRLVSAISTANENKWKWSDEKICNDSKSNLFALIKTLMFKSKGKAMIAGMNIWNVIKLHLIDMATHGNRQIMAKEAVECLRDCISIHLRAEKSGFNSNMFFLEPFHSLLMKDASSEESKEQIVLIFSNLVGQFSSNLGSGWKPLFSALKSLTNASNYDDKQQSTYVSFAVMDIFSKYMEIKDVCVQMSTMSDFICCLTSHMQSRSLCLGVIEVEEGDETLGEAALCCVAKIQILLLRRFIEDNFAPNATLLHRIDKRKIGVESEDNEMSRKINERLRSTKNIVHCLEEDKYLGALFGMVNWNLQLCPEYHVDIKESCWAHISDTQKCVVELTLSLCEQLASLIVTCNQQMHSKVRQNLVDFLMTISTSKMGPSLTGYILCSTLIPVMNNWLCSETLIEPHSSALKNFRQTMGLLTSLTQQFITEHLNNIWTERIILDILELFNNAISQPCTLAIPRIAISCLRHLMESSCKIFTKKHWLILSCSLYRATLITLAPLRELNDIFYPELDEMENVELVKRDNKEEGETVELYLLAKDIFYLTQNDNNLFEGSGSVEVHLTSPDQSKKTKMVSIREFLSHLVNHRLLMQMIDELIVQPSFTTQKFDMCEEGEKTILVCMIASCHVTTEADKRPALKSLIKKILNEERDVNFYKLTGSSFSLLLSSFYSLAFKWKENDLFVSMLELAISTIIQKIADLEDGCLEARYSAAIRERAEVGSEFTILQLDNHLNATEDSKIFKLIRVDSSIDDFEQTKKATIPKRINPFSSTSTDQFPTSPHNNNKQHCIETILDTDLYILCLSSCLAKIIKRYIEENRNYSQITNLFHSIMPKLAKMSTSYQIRECISLYLEKFI